MLLPVARVPGSRVDYCALAAACRPPRRLAGERSTFSVSELLAQNPLIQAVAWIEQHLHGDAVIHVNADRTDRTNLIVIGHRGDRSLLRLKHVDAHARTVGQK